MRGYDAVHCASAEQLDDTRLYAAASAVANRMVGWHGNPRHQPTGHAALSRRFDCQGELLGNVVDQQSGAIPMKGVPKTVTVVGKLGIGTGAPGKLDRRVDGMRRHENPVESARSVILTGGEGRAPWAIQDRRIQHGCAVEEAVTSRGPGRR